MKIYSRFFWCWWFVFTLSILHKNVQCIFLFWWWLKKGFRKFPSSIYRWFGFCFCFFNFLFCFWVTTKIIRLIFLIFIIIIFITTIFNCFSFCCSFSIMFRWDFFFDTIGIILSIDGNYWWITIFIYFLFFSCFIGFFFYKISMKDTIVKNR